MEKGVQARLVGHEASWIYNTGEFGVLGKREDVVQNFSIAAIAQSSGISDAGWAAKSLGYIYADWI